MQVDVDALKSALLPDSICKDFSTLHGRNVLAVRSVHMNNQHLLLSSSADKTIKVTDINSDEVQSKSLRHVT
jgi:hypothetical protein